MTTRIVEVEVIETNTRIAHLKITSEKEITLDTVKTTEVVDEITEAAESLAVERDGGSDVEIRLIPLDQQHRYVRSIDGEIDLDDL